MDVGKFLRLQGAIQSALEEASGKSSTVAGRATEDAYDRLRDAVRDTIPEEDLEEFDRLFPESFVALTPLERFGFAQTLLASLSGWLGGYVQQARLDQEARAYAEARVKAERGVGFKGSKAE